MNETRSMKATRSKMIVRLQRQGLFKKKKFGRRCPTRDSELPMQLKCMGSREPPVRVQMHIPGRAHWRSTGKHKMLSVFKTS